MVQTPHPTLPHKGGRGRRIDGLRCGNHRPRNGSERLAIEVYLRSFADHYSLQGFKHLFYWSAILISQPAAPVPSTTSQGGSDQAIRATSATRARAKSEGANTALVQTGR
jgi:hypothetical protein